MSAGGFLERDDIPAAEVEFRGLSGKRDSFHENTWAHNAFKAVAADLTGDVKQPVPIRDFGQVIDEETGFEGKGHNAPAPNWGNSATLFFGERLLSGRLTESNSRGLPTSIAPISPEQARGLLLSTIPAAAPILSPMET